VPAAVRVDDHLLDEKIDEQLAVGFLLEVGGAALVEKPLTQERILD
jgi:hypothetical protein